MQQLARREARRPVRAGRSEYTSDYEITISVMLVFFGLFCLVGAWWLHHEHVRGPAALMMSAPAGPSAAPPSAYARAITTMTSYCTQNAAQLGKMVHDVQRSEAKAGVTQSLTSIARHLAAVTAANGEPMPCAQQFADYATRAQG